MVSSWLFNNLVYINICIELFEAKKLLKTRSLLIKFKIFKLWERLSKEYDANKKLRRFNSKFR